MATHYSIAELMGDNPAVHDLGAIGRNPPPFHLNDQTFGFSPLPKISAPALANTMELGGV